ncbi:O-antigen ligase family protein [Magnetospirillum molischianum]|uniref:O-antigen ligase-related domain-containing protein n=1 Tax=Magnetospirillum molischianum DSM 120 TaxID=1150626 RepID=H8FSP1_MAGML|nr:O-antigen ligase family protein [Magnetospirillum molischianum]CCG41379.1 membrane hypothetical protein [Magnetospirillum molischianum DSM 120]
MPSTPMATALIQAMLAVVIASSPLLVFFSPDHWQLLYGISVLILTILGALLLMEHFQVNVVIRIVLMFLLIAVPPELSLLVNDYDEPRLPKILAVVAFYGVLGGLILHRPADVIYRSMFAFLILTLMISTVLVLVLSVNSSDFGFVLSLRRSAFDLEEMGLHPNYGGLLATAIAVAGCGLSSITRRIGLAAFCVFVCWLMESRGGLLGVIAAFGIGYACRGVLGAMNREETKRRSGGWVIGGVAAGLLLLVYGSSLTSFISRELLLLDDANRGLDSGFSGRSEVWREAWEQWLDYPLFGLGFMHDLELGGSEDMNRAHNLPLTLLSETGLIGLAGFVGFSLWGVAYGVRLGRQGQVTSASYVITTISVYWIYGIFEGLSLNVGNPLSAMFFLVAFASAASPKSA